MAKQRMINTKIWEDAWFNSLDPTEKLFFVYLLTNPMTNIIGAYELSKGTMGRATGLESMVVDEILVRFEKAGKVYFRDGWVVLSNFIKHQNYRSPKIQVGVNTELQNVPENIGILIKKPLDLYGTYTISHLNSNSNSNINRDRVSIKGKEKDYMYNYEDIDESGNPIKKKRLGKMKKEENEFLISVGFLWQEMASSHLGIPKRDVILLNIYYPIRSCYDREKWNKEEYKELFKYFLNDKNIKDENKLSFDLCLSQKYIAKFKLSKRLKKKTNASIASEIKL